jgi:hypothetical protein
LIYTGSGVVGAFVVIDDGTNACTVSIKDGTSGSGSEILPWVSGGDGVPTGWEDIECEFDDGLYLDITTAGTVKIVVLYKPD